MSRSLRIPNRRLVNLCRNRPAAFCEEVRRVASVESGHYVIPLETWTMLTRKHRRPGLGDLVSAIATPIARLLRLPCVDKNTKELRPESPCAKRKAALNRLTR